MLLFAEAAVGRTWFVELQLATCSLANPMLSICVSLEVARSAKKWEPTVLVRLVRRFVDDRTVLEASQIKHPYTSICPTTHKYVYALGAKSHVKHLLVMSDELRLCSKRGDVPDGAGSVYTRSDDETR
jgi:hypothetical protein